MKKLGSTSIAAVQERLATWTGLVAVARTGLPPDFAIVDLRSPTNVLIASISLRYFDSETESGWFVRDFSGFPGKVGEYLWNLRCR